MQVQRNIRSYSTRNSPDRKLFVENKRIEDVRKLGIAIPSASAHLEIKRAIERMSSNQPIQTNKSLRKHYELTPIFLQDENKADYDPKLRIASQPQMQDHNIPIKNKTNILPVLDRFKTDVPEYNPIKKKCTLNNNIVLDKMNKIIEILKQEEGTTISSTIDTKRHYNKSIKFNEFYRKSIVTKQNSNTLEDKQNTIELRQILKKKGPYVLEIDMFKEQEATKKMKNLIKFKEGSKEKKPQTQNRSRQKSIFFGLNKVYEQELFTFYPKTKKNNNQGDSSSQNEAA